MKSAAVVHNMHELHPHKMASSVQEENCILKHRSSHAYILIIYSSFLMTFVAAQASILPQTEVDCDALHYCVQSFNQVHSISDNGQ